MEAGIPAAVPMTQKIIEWFDAPGPEPENARILRFVEAGLRLRQSVRGKNPSQGINVEELFGAVELLANRHSLEIEPFVNQWHPLLEELEATISADVSWLCIDLKGSLQSLIQKIEERDFPSAQCSVNQLVKDLEKPLQQIPSRLRSSRTFERVKHAMITTMTELVWCTNPEKIEYLKPLVLQGNPQVLTIATLNYDNTIELTCEAAGIPFTIGLEQWEQFGEFQKPQQGIELLKLHGSVDWSMFPDPRAPGVPLSDATVRRVPLSERRSYSVVIFGGGNKLTVDGPFLDLVKTFQRRLEEHTTLVVIGYSFGDFHINRLIERWLRRSKERNIIIIERPKRHEFEDIPLPQLIHGNSLVFESRFDFRPVGASKGIADLFGGGK